MRRVVTGAIEIYRQEKLIGSSLEASPLVYIDDEKLYQKIDSIDFSEVCITSDIEVRPGVTKSKSFTLDDVENVQVIFKMSKGHKCQRCWKYVDTFPPNAKYVKTCVRCDEVLQN